MLVGAALVACAGSVAAGAGTGASDAPWWRLAAGLAVFGETASVSAYLLTTLFGLLVDIVSKGTAGTAVAMGAAAVAVAAWAWSRRDRFARVAAEVNSELDVGASGRALTSADAAARAPEPR